MFSALHARQHALRARYAEPHRAYHTQAHIDAMLRELHALGPPVARPDAVELAIWYHDAIYDPAASDNEARSAELLLSDLSGLADPALLHTAAAMVRATATHTLPPGLPAAAEADCAAFLDLDMAILGAPPAEYDAYEAGIAAEYEPVFGPDRYRAGRAAFLRGALNRPRLFLTDAAHAALDAQARANLGRALAACEVGTK